VPLRALGTELIGTGTIGTYRHEAPAAAAVRRLRDLAWKARGRAGTDAPARPSGGS